MRLRATRLVYCVPLSIIVPSETDHFYDRGVQTVEWRRDNNKEEEEESVDLHLFPDR